MPARMIVCLLLALTACTGGSSQRAAAPTPPSASVGSIASAAPSPSATPAAVPLVVAVADKRGGLALYAVAPHAHVAVLVRRLAGPTKNVVEQVSLAAGPTPSVCAVWTRELRCYRSGAVKGRVVSRNPGYGVGIRSDGGAVAWTESEANQLLVIADLNGDVTTVRMRERFAKGAPADAGIPESLDDLHWLAPRTLVATSNGDSDEGRGLCVIDLDHPREQEGDGAGLGRCLQPRGAQASLGYAHFEEAALVEPGVVVAVERAPGCCVENPNQPAGRAVRLRLSDGAVLGVFATARAGRDVTDVSGGPRAVLYRPGRKARTSPSRCAGRVTRMAPR